MIIISFGSNETVDCNSALQGILKAYALLESCNVRILKRSRFYLTEPYGVTSQPEFTNSAISIQTSLSPHSLLRVVKKIEAIAGRRPGKKRWAVRVIDLDIIDYNGLSLTCPKSGCVDFTHVPGNLILPHPGIPYRPFVLQPIVDIAPFWHHHISGLTASQMLKRLPRNAPGKILKMIE